MRADDRGAGQLRASIALAANPIQARAAIAAEWGGRRASELGTGRRAGPPRFECLPADLAFLWIGNPNDSSWPQTLAGFPAMVQFLGNFADFGDAPAGTTRPG